MARENKVNHGKNLPKPWPVWLKYGNHHIPVRKNNGVSLNFGKSGLHRAFQVKPGYNKYINEERERKEEEKKDRERGGMNLWKWQITLTS